MSNDDFILHVARRGATSIIITLGERVAAGSLERKLDALRLQYRAGAVAGWRVFERFGGEWVTMREGGVCGLFPAESLLPRGGAK